MIDGVALLGRFTEDFTLAELETLRAEEPVPALRPDNQAFDAAERHGPPYDFVDDVDPRAHAMRAPRAPR